MEFKEFTAGKNDDSRRLDKLLKTLLPQRPLSDINKLIRKGLIRLNEKKTKADIRISEGDVIKIAAFLFNSTSKLIKNDEKKVLQKDFSANKGLAAEKTLRIIYEDENFLIINKPYDINVHGSSKENTALDSLVRFYLLSNSKSQDLAFTPGSLHRLDRKTSGLLVFSKSLNGARWFTKQLNNHKIKKTYCAVLQGKLTKEEKWTDYIFSQEESGKQFHTVLCSSEKKEGWKEAKSKACPLAYGKYEDKIITLAKIEIETGRKHQIRAQSALHGFPLLGDSSYGGCKIKDKKLLRDLYLCATSLSFDNQNEDCENEAVYFPQLFKFNYDEEFFDIIEYCDIRKIGI